MLIIYHSIAGLGFTTTVNAQLLTVPGMPRKRTFRPTTCVLIIRCLVYFVAAVSYVLLAFLSDRFKNRSTFLLIALSFCLIGYIILIASSKTGVRYFGVFMVAVGLYATQVPHEIATTSTTNVDT